MSNCRRIDKELLEKNRFTKEEYEKKMNEQRRQMVEDNFKKGQKEVSPKALENAVDTLIHMATQKSAGQSRQDNKKDVPFVALEMIKWTIIFEACYLVLDEKWDEVKELFKNRAEQ